MSRADDVAAYSRTAVLLHWIVAGLVVVQFTLAALADDAAETGSKLRQLALLANHKSVGITILVVMVARLAWRLVQRPPGLPDSMPRWQVTASKVSHWSMYVLLLAMPITGWLMSSASAYSVSWFNQFQLPDFVAPDPALKDFFLGIHETLAALLFGIAVIHVAAALKHFFVDKDNVVQRISPRPGLVLFAVIVITGIVLLGSPVRAAAAPPADDRSEVPAERATAPLPRWDIDYASSHIRFTAVQAGARFTGIWESWEATICFSPDSLDDSVFDVSIDTREVETRDADRNATLAEAEWFDSARHPNARYHASRFEKNADGSFTAHGSLTIKDRSGPVALKFSVEGGGTGRVLVGEATIDRLALGVGTGEWVDTTWIGKDVIVAVRVEGDVAE